MSEISFLAKGACQLCDDTQFVEVNRRKGGINDGFEDECPWCLRRELNKTEQALKDSAMLMRMLLAKPTESRREKAWRFLQKHGLAGNVLRVD